MKIAGAIVSVILVLCMLSCNRASDSGRINCNGLDTDTAGVNDNGRIYMPNAFTPNGDGLNDILRPTTQNITAMAFTIYDNDNNVVFNTTQLGAGWQPVTPANTSVIYYYRIQAATASNHYIGLCGEVYNLTCFPVSVPKSDLHFEDQLTPNGFTGVTSENLPVCQ